jgi:transposase
MLFIFNNYSRKYASKIKIINRINFCWRTSYFGYLALQDLFHFPYYSNYEESLKFIEFLSQKLDNSFSILLKKVGETYHRWRFEIANAFTVGNKEIRYTNAIAECLNNQLKTIIKSAYGYHNFERFRKRAILITTYRKKP